MSEEIWLSLVDYAKYRNVSISTIRRYIKAQRVRYKKTDGKFFILVPADKSENFQTSEQKLMALKISNELLENKFNKLKEDNYDLKMLVSLYEKNQINNLHNLHNNITQEEVPEIPNS